MELGQLPAQRYLPLPAKSVRQVPEGGNQLVGGLVEDHGPLLPPQGLQVGPAVFLVHGQKALKGEAAGGLAGGCQRRDQGAGTRDGYHRDPGSGTQGHHLLPRVGDGRHPRVRDQSTALPCQQAVQHRLTAGCGVVPVVGDHRLLQPQMVEELHCHPGVFCGNEVRLRQSIRHPRGDVPQIADGSRDQIEGSCHALCSFPPPPTLGQGGSVCFHGAIITQDPPFFYPRTELRAAHFFSVPFPAQSSPLPYDMPPLSQRGRRGTPRRPLAVLS